MKLAGLTLAYWSLIVAALLPFVCAVLAKRGSFGVGRHQGGFDNHQPRAWLARQTGWRARANAAQANSFEALPLFMAAVIVAHQLGANQVRLDLMAFLFVVLRMVYILLYLADLASARSAVWALALLVNLAIFFV
ncbi:MAG: MAPEG family protein [Hydrogenophaga sp.]|jgi:uncharacterized MAPEG superfamily protein|uniref:MAPEG family protein n=1 Tax=Hydrogenophaga sp. TaxID=1904254 RepID=UPI000EC980A1|nr:MAPEG family protein [Hydrogenophaga sp.]MDD3784946.1 MAPEG family protein [Hydrogenophaga sp.]MDX9968130.1 MAPEG family protein [Hydrogenophaga sp.]HAJ12866.1 glutathione metabolism protein [Comamonadaceae bacterium]